MCGRAEEDGAQLSVRRIHTQHRHAAVGKPARIDAEDDAIRREFATIHGEVDDARAVREFRGLQFGIGCNDGVHDLVHQLFRVFNGARRFTRRVFRNHPQGQRRPGMRV